MREESSARERLREDGPRSPVRVLYCGNFGRMHEVDTVVAALRGGVPAGVRIDFRGNGAGFQTLAAAMAGLRSCRAGTASECECGAQEIRNGGRRGVASESAECGKPEVGMLKTGKGGRRENGRGEG